MLFEWELQLTLFDWREFLQHNRVRTAGKIFYSHPVTYVGKVVDRLMVHVLYVHVGTLEY